MKTWYFFKKMKGGGVAPPRVSFFEIFWSFLGSFLGIGLVALLHFLYFAKRDLIFIIAPFGASAVLIYGAPKSPFAQPRNLIGGHFFSALSGVLAYKLFPQFPYLACALAVGCAITFMHFTRTLHPPGGATALLAILGGEKIHQLGLLYPFFPVTTGVLLLLIVALLLNNLSEKRKYPEYWL